MVALDKKTIRQEMIQKRRALSKEEWQNKSMQILDTLLSSSFFCGPIGIYMDIKQEVWTGPLLDHCLKHHIPVAIPKVEKDGLVFYYIHSYDEFEEGTFHVLEPTTHTLAKDLKTLIVPLVAFNDTLDRIGYGKGYYDQYLNQHEVKTIGIAFEFQKASFKKETHDHPLNHIITEVKIY